MKTILPNDYQKILLNILKAFQKYCKDNEIRVLLCGGTAIGAIRHKGFIPWDDDIDLYIFRDGFDKLMSLAQANPYIDEEKRYKILIPGKFPSTFPFFKVIDTRTIVYERTVAKKFATGAWVDVFCLSHWAENSKIAEKQFKKQQFYMRMIQLMRCGNCNTLKHKCIEICTAPIRVVFNLFGMNSEYWCKKILSLDKYQSGTHVGNICWPNSFEKEYYKAEWFDESIEVTFEDATCEIAKDYDSILTHFYGDYMTVPPEEKRIRHDPEAYYRD